jgi:hypothetical protein
MKIRKLRLLAVFGLLGLPLLGVLLPKHTQASAPVQVDVLNKPTVTVGNTPNVNVTNTPNVSVSNTPNVSVTNTPNVNVANQVGISSMPAVQIASGNVAATITAPVNVITYAELYPIEMNGQCQFQAGTTACTVDNVYTVPDGFNVVITDFTGTCPVEADHSPNSAQLFAQWGGITQAYTTPIVAINGWVVSFNGGGAVITVGYGWAVTGAKFYGAAGTSVTLVLSSAYTSSGYQTCSYSISGYLLPTGVSSSVPSASFPARGTSGIPRGR